MDNALSRLVWLAALTLASLALLGGAAAKLLLADSGLSAEIGLVLGLGLGLLSFACTQVFGSSLWSALPPNVARLLGIPPPEDRS